MNLMCLEVIFMGSHHGGGISSTIYFDAVLRTFQNGSFTKTTELINLFKEQYLTQYTEP